MNNNGKTRDNKECFVYLKVLYHKETVTSLLRKKLRMSTFIYKYLSLFRNFFFKSVNDDNFEFIVFYFLFAFVKKL